MTSVAILVLALTIGLVATPPSAAAQCGSAARLEALGPGTPNSASAPLLSSAGAPIVGLPFSLRVGNGPAGGIGLLLACHQGGPATFLPEFGATLHPGIPYRSQAFVFGPTGTATALLATPAVAPGLCGTELVVQVAARDSAATGGALLSNGLRLRYGAPERSAPVLGPLPSVTRDDGITVSGRAVQAGNAIRIEGGAAPVETRAGADHVFHADVRLQRDAVNLLTVREVFPGNVLGPARTIEIEQRTGSRGPIFAGATYPVGLDPSDVAVGDLDRDGVPDLVVSSSSIVSTSVYVLLGQGDGVFGTAREFDSGLSPSAVALADIDVDGVLDVAVANTGSNSVSLLVGRGDGTFFAPIVHAVGSGPRAIELEDLNEDGLPDIVASNRDSNDVSVLLGRPAGQFAAAMQFDAGTRPGDLAVGDLNRDGVPDLAVVNLNSDGVSILLGSGTGTFGSPWSLSVPGGPDSLALGDLDQDGLKDLAVACRGSNRVLLFVGAAGGLLVPGQSVPVGTNPDFLIIEDLDENGSIDLIVANWGSNDVSVLLADGSGGYAVDEFRTVESPKSLALRDLDQDGVRDLVIVSGRADLVSVRPGLANGSFAGPLTLTVGADPRSVAVGDFDRNGIPDLASANWGSDSVSILLGAGGGDFAVARHLAVASHPSAISAVDMNRDGQLDLVVANEGFPPTGISVLLGDGAGDFAPPSFYPVFGLLRSIATADLNSDGWPDVVVVRDAAGTTFNGALVLLGDGSGGLGPAVGYTASPSSQILAVGDLDQDGFLDFLVGSPSSGLESFRGDGVGGFMPPTLVTPAGARSIAVIDLDSDGDLDIAGIQTPGRVFVRLGDGAGSFGPALFDEAGSTGASLTIGDVDGDGRTDIVTANDSTFTASLLLGRGDGSFSAAGRFEAGKRASSVVIADLNQDGSRDVVATNRSSNTLSVLFNRH